jgi:hypothetical protein
MATSQEYHNDPAQHGNYQYTSLKDVIDGMVTQQLEEDSYIKNTNRNLLIYYAKDGIKQLTKDLPGGRLAIEITVGPKGYIVLPEDYVGGGSVSVVIVDPSTGSRKLFPLDRNSNINTATGILQDDEAEIIFDDNGEIVTADASNAYNIPHKSYGFTSSCEGVPYLDASMYSANGEYIIDEKNGHLILDDRLIDREIVLFYKSDGLQWESFGEGDIKVHKYIEEALKDWIYYACIEKRQLVSNNEKRRALDRFKTTKFKAKKQRSNINLQQIAREMRSKSKY